MGNCYWSVPAYVGARPFLDKRVCETGPLSPGAPHCEYECAWEASAHVACYVAGSYGEDPCPIDVQRCYPVEQLVVEMVVLCVGFVGGD